MQMSFFPSRTMSIYMGRMFLIRCLAVLAMLVIVLQTLDLLGESGKILARPMNSESTLWVYVSLRLPQIIAFVLPFSVLLGTLITLTQLNANSEVISMKAAGLSAHQVLAPLIVVALGIAAVSFTFNERIVARATATLKAWQQADYGPIPAESGVQSNVWLRHGEDLINAEFVFGRGDTTVLRGVEIIDRRGNALVSIVRGPQARRHGDGWRLEDARQFDVASGTVTAIGAYDFATGVTDDQFTLSKVDADAQSFMQLGESIDALAAAGRPTNALRGEYWHKLSGPLSAILMPLLGSVAAFGLARSGKLFVRAVIGMGLGFAYFVADNFALAMGNLGAYPPFLAAWAPFFLFLLLGEAVLVRTEE